MLRIALRQGRAGFIAATAIAHDLPLYTQDEGFSSLTGLDLHLV